MNGFESRVSDLYVEICRKAFELNVISDFDITVHGTRSIRLQITKFDEKINCASAFTKDIMWSIYPENALEQLQELNEKLQQSIEEGAPLLEWVLDVSEKYLEKHEPTKQELVNLFDLEESCVEHLFPKEVEQQPLSRGHITQSEQKLAGHKYYDFI